MFIKRKGAYIACGKDFSALIYVVGEFPHFKIVSGIILNNFVEKGEIISLDKNSIELIQMVESPTSFIFAPISNLSENNLKGLDKLSTGVVEFDQQEHVEWIEYYKELERYGLPMNKLIARIMLTGRSLPQANVTFSIIERKVKAERR